MTRPALEEAPRFRRVIAERASGGWLVMWADGAVEWFANRRAVLAAIRRTATGAVDVAEVEWREYPEGSGAGAQR